MTIKVEKDVLTTATTITERFTGPFLGTETAIETTHMKLYPIDSNTFSFSVTFDQTETPHHHGRRTRIYQVGHVIHDEFLVSNEICSIHLKKFLSLLHLQPYIQDYIVRYISTEALKWKTYREGGYKVEVNVKVNVEYKERDGEIGLTELSDAVSRIDLGCSGEKEMKDTRKCNYVSTSKTSREEINGCILDKKIIKRTVQIESRPIESKAFSFLIKYEKRNEVDYGNLDGHKIRVTTLKRPVPRRKLEYAFPDQFVVSEETCSDQILNALSDMNFPPNDREYLASYLSKEAIVWNSYNKEGILYEINVKDKFDRSFEVKFCSGEGDGCSSRISTTRIAETGCAICLKGLSGAVSRMEFACTHIFHKDCVKRWLMTNPSCPLCRNIVVGRVAFYC